MIELKALLGILAVLIALIGYIPYFRDIFLGKTKPHAFSWLVWTILTWTAFAGQLVAGAGPGAWVIGFSGIACVAVFLLALKKGEKNIYQSDWLCLIGAGVAI